MSPKLRPTRRHRTGRASRSGLWAFAVALLVFGSGIVVPAAARAQDTRSIALGADTKKIKGQTEQTSLLRVESELGRTVAFTRDFLLWDDPFPTPYENWLGARGTVPMISVKSRLASGTPVPWASVANAQPGSAIYDQIVSWADRMRDYGYDLYFTYNHEPEAATNNDLGSPADYIAAWRRVHDIVVQQGATNVRFMWIMTDYAFRVGPNDARYAPKWYPGDAYVDGIAADAYNWSTCRYPNGNWQTLAGDTAGFVAFGAKHPDTPMWLTEFASVEDPARPDAKAQWITDAQGLLQQPGYSQIVGVSYFNQTQSRSPCDWPVETSAPATAAFAAMARDPAFGAAVTFGSDPPPPPPTGVTFSGAASTTGNATTEKVTVPASTVAGDALVLVATSASPVALTAPPGWTTVASVSSPSMASAVWARTATPTDAGTVVPITFAAVTKGSVELLDYTGYAGYTGTDTVNPVVAATPATYETSRTSVTTPAPASATGNVVSYWAVRSSLDTTLVPDSSLTARAAESGTGGGRITSASADAASGSAGVSAAVAPSVSHALAWSLVLAPAP